MRQAGSNSRKREKLRRKWRSEDLKGMGRRVGSPVIRIRCRLKSHSTNIHRQLAERIMRHFSTGTGVVVRIRIDPATGSRDKLATNTRLKVATLGVCLISVQYTTLAKPSIYAGSRRMGRNFSF